jgi:hypothetical protein
VAEMHLLARRSFDRTTSDSLALPHPSLLCCFLVLMCSLEVCADSDYAMLLALGP